jgi:hypothetical protein
MLNYIKKIKNEENTKKDNVVNVSLNKNEIN